jgi:4-carboxymuconolactone decarboxylase
MQQLGAAVRYHTHLTPRVRELAILAVAAHHRSPFEQFAHEAVGRSIGLTEEEMRAVGERDTPALTDVSEIAALRLTWALLSGDVDDDTWDFCVGQLTIEVAYELLVLVGYYSTLAMQMRVLRTDSLPDQDPSDVPPSTSRPSVPHS